jgi:hypothetical protein
VADKEGPSVIDLCCTLFLELLAKHPIFATPTPVGASSTWSFGVELLHLELEPYQTGPKTLWVEFGLGLPLWIVIKSDKNNVGLMIVSRIFVSTNYFSYVQ